jgi:hypothetical protein
MDTTTEERIPTVAFGNAQITRIISGGNPLCGNSHFSLEADSDMRDYFTAEEVVRYLHAVESSGINTLQARGDYHRVLHWIELFRREGGRLQWIAQTASEMSDVHQNIRILAAGGAIGIYNHGTQTDNHWLNRKIDLIQDNLKVMRDSGVQVGLGTHIPEVIEYAEEKGWDVDFYMACFYNLNRKPRESAIVSGLGFKANDEAFLPEDPPAMCRVIRSTEKTCLAFKILGAGRCCESEESVEDAFKFAFANIKPKDAVVVGMFPKYTDQIRQNVGHAMKCCTY